jgi:hypothetical protein
LSLKCMEEGDPLYSHLLPEAQEDFILRL